MQEDADGHIVEIGARTRTIPPALRRALQRRDKRCTFPGCHVWIAEGHHIKHWAQGGPTKLSNLAVLCRRHHRAVHEDVNLGWAIDVLHPGANPLTDRPERTGSDDGTSTSDTEQPDS